MPLLASFHVALTYYFSNNPTIGFVCAFRILYRIQDACGPKDAGLRRTRNNQNQTQRCIQDFNMTLPGCILAYIHNLCKSCSGRSGRVAENFHGRVDRYPMKLVHILPLYFHPHPLHKLHVTVIASISNKLNISFGHFPP